MTGGITNGEAQGADTGFVEQQKTRDRLALAAPTLAMLKELEVLPKNPDLVSFPFYSIQTGYLCAGLSYSEREIDSGVSYPIGTGPVDIASITQGVYGRPAAIAEKEIQETKDKLEIHNIPYQKESTGPRTYEVKRDANNFLSIGNSIYFTIDPLEAYESLKQAVVARRLEKTLGDDRMIDDAFYAKAWGLAARKLEQDLAKLQEQQRDGRC